MKNRRNALAILALLAAAGTAAAAPRLVAVTGTTIYDINPITGVFTQTGTITGAAAAIGEVAFDCETGRAWVVSTGNDTLYTLDLATGVATVVGVTGPSTVVMHGLQYDTTNDTLYAVNSNNTSLYSLDQTTGAGTLIGPIGAGAASFTNIALDSRTGVLYAVSTGSVTSTNPPNPGFADALFTLNRATGAGTFVGYLQSSDPNQSPNPNPHGLTYNKDTGAMYLIDTATNASEGFYFVDTATGQKHQIAKLPPGNFLAMAYIPDNCAEPTVPAGAGYTTPMSQLPGQAITAVVHVLPVAGATPSTGIQVVGDFTQVGGSNAVVLTPGVNDNFSTTINLASNQAAGTFIIPLTISDAQGRVGAGSVAIKVRPGAPAGFVVEAEPNETKATATVGTITAGTGVFGYSAGASTSTPGDPSADTFRLKTAPLAPAIYRHRLVITTEPLNEGHTGTLRGLQQSNTLGIIATTDVALQTSASTTTPARFNQWYGFGKEEEFYYRVAGTTTATFSEYFATMSTEVVTPVNIPTTFAPGLISIGRPADLTFNVGILVYDANYEPVSDFAYAGPEGLLRDFAAGTYYIAVSNTTTTDSRPTPPDAPTRTGSVPDFADIVVNSSTTINATWAREISNGSVTEIVATPKSGAFDVTWLKLTVGEVVTAPRCNPADIANDDGSPLPPNGPAGGVNNGVTEGDYNLFFARFFDSDLAVDIANDDGSPLPPFGPLATNNGVTEGDYNLFFSIFFDGCAF